MSNTTTRDRYISFAGLDCDVNATHIVDTIRTYIADPAHAGKWSDYFTKKFEEKKRLGVDDLFFVGSQVNTIYMFLDEIGDQPTHELLYQVEQECC